MRLFDVEWATLDECAHALGSAQGSLPKDRIKQELLAAFWLGKLGSARLPILLENYTEDPTLSPDDLRRACWEMGGLRSPQDRPQTPYLAEKTNAEGKHYTQMRVHLAAYEQSNIWSFEELAATPYDAYCRHFRRAYLDSLELATDRIAAFKQSPQQAGDVGRRATPTHAYSRSCLEEWYVERVANWPENKSPPSREDDLRAAQEELLVSVPRNAVRDIRREHAPAKWGQKGRRRKP